MSQVDRKVVARECGILLKMIHPNIVSRCAYIFWLPVVSRNAVLKDGVLCTRPLVLVIPIVFFNRYALYTHDLTFIYVFVAPLFVFAYLGSSKRGV